MARIRTLNFLPEIFQTPSNSEFLSATLDQLVNPPSLKKIQGYVGSKLGYGVNASDYYVTEPNKTRTDYQLTPSVVFTKPNESVAKDFISYPGMIDALKMKGSITEDNNRLFQSQFYSWDSFTNLDKLVNYHQYYWLADGPPAVTVAASSVYLTEDYTVADQVNSYQIYPTGSTASVANPIITLLRGGTYTFTVNQDSEFWIQGEPGVSGYSATQPNLPVRDVFGVTNNGAEDGVVTFVVPQADAQDEYNFAINNVIDVVSTVPFDQIDGKLLSEVVDIDGITSLDGLRVIFYDTGVVNEQGYISSWFAENEYDTNDPALVSPVTLTVSSCTTSAFTLASGNTNDLVVGQTVTFDAPTFGGVVAGQVYFINNIPSSTSFSISTELAGSNVTLVVGSGTMTVNVNQGLLEDGYYTTVADNYYRIQYLGSATDPILKLIPDGTINQNEKITPTYGTVYANRPFYKNSLGVIELIPYISAPLDVLYYQDGTTASKVGIIRIIDNNNNNTIDVINDILGKTDYTSPNGVVFTNGLKVQFDGDVVPSSYLEGQYYVEGVGTAIELVSVNDLVCPEEFTQGEYLPFDMTPYDIGNYEINLYLPVLQDYITIARNSISRNAWSRSNRWFHIDVIKATALYNKNPDILEIANLSTKAKRPIIEFYPNLKLFNSGIVGKSPVDFIDNRTTDALSQVAGALNYYPDIQVYTTNTGTVTTAVSTTTTTVTVPVNAVTGTLLEGMYITDSDNLLPNNTVIDSISSDGVTYTLTVSWASNQSFTGNTGLYLVASATTVNNYSLFPGARVIFANDTDPNVRNKIFVSQFSALTVGGTPVITLTVAEDGNIDVDTEVVAIRGYNNEGLSYWYNGSEWTKAQEKLNVNQPPLFDIFDKNGISYSDNDIYQGTSFAGCKLFAYGIGSGTNDPILGFPVRYSGISNIGDISFDVSLNDDTFSYVSNGSPITQNVNTGYVYDYTTTLNVVRKLGWETAVAPSVQYQVFSFDFDVNSPVTLFTCDVAALSELSSGQKGWPRVKVFYNNVYKEQDIDYTYSTTSDTTVISLLKNPSVSEPIQVLVLSDQVSNTGYYDIPINLSNNPLNEVLKTVDIGDIRNQYQSIFVNAPNTVGEIFGENNYRDCGNINIYGTSIIQNSAALALPGAFLRNPAHNLFDALLFNSREYVKFKQLIVNTVENTDYVQRFTPSAILDDALDQIAASRSEYNAFFWSDMLPSKTPYISNTYVFNNALDNTIYPLSKVYNFGSASYEGVLVYILRTVNNVRVEMQLLRDIDYTISADSPSLTITMPLNSGDNVIIKEYNQTYGSYVPNTPTKLGLYKSFEPGVVLDSNYSTPTYFIQGHDGSFTKLYGTYNPNTGILVDFRDQALLEFEQRIYNNLKLSTSVPINEYEILPGYFRQSESTYTYDEFLEMYSSAFLNWVGQNRLDYKTQYFSKTNEFTYNYTNSGNKLNQTAIQQGYWRGIYIYFYDTSTPNLTPWEMLGFSEIPDWWTTRYGPAPYTNQNTILWTDLENGYVWNNGNSYVIEQMKRPGLSSIIPVDSAGNIVSPFKAVMGNYNPSTFQKDWKVGDVGPVEFSYRRSSTWPFDLVRLFALTRPAEFYNLAVDLDNYKYNAEFNQYLVDDRYHLVLNEIEVYGNGTPKTSFINWVVDYEKQQGIDATAEITTMLDNIDVRLAYRLAGYSDKTMLDFFVEKGTPNSKNSSLLIPDESYSVLLYDNQPFTNIMFSGVVVQQNQGYWTVYGNSQTFAYFEIQDPKFNGMWRYLSVEKQKVKVAVDYETTTTLVPYGTKFYSTQDVAQFLISYGKNLSLKGMVFDKIQNGVHVTWDQMVLEFLYWAQSGWSAGSIVTLNPAAQLMDINSEDAIVQPLTIQQQNFLLNQNLYPIKLNDLCVNRDGTRFTVHTLNSGDTMSYGQFNLSNFEHAIVFNNTTLFNDVIYNTVTGLRQNRIYVRGSKTNEWNGTVNAYGFILNQDNVQPWNNTLKYTKGVIVKYKNKYWTSLKVIEPSLVFNEQDWKEINYDNVQKGLLANPSTRAYENTLYYDIYEANLERDADLLGFSLIGYRPRDYLSLIDLTDVAQVQVYKNLIKNKGTRNAVEAFKGANLPQGGIQYDVYENWAIQSGSYGGILNENFVDFKVNQANMTGDPAIVSLTNGVWTAGSMQEVSINNLYNYNTKPTTPDILSTTSLTQPISLYPSAGYVNYNDVKMASYFYSGLPLAADSNNKTIPITDFYVGDYMWLANFKERWEVYSWKTIGQVVSVKANQNNTSTITFNKPHNLSKLDPISIINFAPNVDGYYLVAEVASLTEVIINLRLINAGNASVQGRGLGFAFVSQRVATPSEIAGLDLVDNEFTKETVWVDENNDGGWAVYRKSINYQSLGEVDIPVAHELGNYGTSVAYTEQSGYLAGDAIAGAVYRYVYYDNSGFALSQQLGGASSFGTAIAYANNVYAISQPTASPRVKIYVINDTPLSDTMLSIQTITAQDGSTNWGSKLAFSDDGRWLYISAIDLGKVYVYRKQNIELDSGYFVVGQTYTITNVGDTDFTLLGAVDNKVGITFVATGAGTAGETGAAMQVTYQLVNTITGNIADNFSSSLATTYRGNTVVVGASSTDYSGSITDWGKVFVYARTEQNGEIQYNSVPYQPQSFALAWTPSNIAGKASTQVSSSQYIDVASTTGLAVDMPVMFVGTDFGDTGIQPYVVYYIAQLSGGNKFSIKSSRSSTSYIPLTNDTGLNFTAYAQSNSLYVSVNGIDVDDSNYATVGNMFYYVTDLRAGDIVNVSDNQFVLQQELNSDYVDRVGIQFGTSVDVSKLGASLVVGSPFEIDAENKEGAVYNYVNGGAKYGVVIGTEECNVTTTRTVLINGYAVTLLAGDATYVAQQINANKITNIQAAATSDNKLMIQLVNQSLAMYDEKLVITAFSSNVLDELGIQMYTKTQIVKCPHEAGPTQFGRTIKLNDQDSLLVAATSASRYEGTVFDFTDDEDLDNDTIFDNNATRFVDVYPNAGAVYMFDYLSNYNESLINPGQYVYAQSTNDTSTDYGFNPQYGLALEFNDNVVMIGSPNYQPTASGGRVIVYDNTTGNRDWSVYRQSASIVDIEKIQNSQLYSITSNNTLVNFDYPDPLQNKLLGVVREHLDYVSGVDPANYNVNNEIKSGLVWGSDHVGKMWFNTNNVRWMNYHQNDVVYNSRYWGQVFPGSDVAVYTWVSSFVSPANYQGPGSVYNVNQYVVSSAMNSSNVVVPVYYFWVRNTNTVFSNTRKTLSDSVIASYIANPRGSGVTFMAPLLPNTFAMYNAGQYFNGTDTVFHIGYASGTATDVAHTEYNLIRTNYADDFLPGLPNINETVSTGSVFGSPYSLYAKMLDSLSGCNDAGQVVPNPLLPPAVQQGVLNNPRQGFFYDRYLALKNYLTFANEIMLQYPIVEIKEELSFLFTSGEFYDTTNYWEYVNWWAAGYNNNTKTSLQVSSYGDLSALSSLPVNTLVKVEQNGAGFFEVYRYDGSDVWTRVGLENGTIQFKNTLWDYAAGKLGYSGNFFDTDSFDSYPSEETRNIIRALNEQIYTDELLIYRNKSLILLFEYIQSETIESQNYLPWLNKTSLADVSHTIRELVPYEVYTSDNQTFLSEYINEVKPYHVVIKDFTFKYEGNDSYNGEVTDFDVPATWNSTYQEFISPEIVYTANTDNRYQSTFTDDIWQTSEYTQWYQNYGLSFGTPVYQNGNLVNYIGQENYPITTLTSYLAFSTPTLIVDNANGFPINGIITLGSEKISYSYVDRANNILGGLVRGIDGTEIQDHIPGEQIYIDLPAALVLAGGRGYTNPPRVTAVIDTTVFPIPTVEAEFEVIMSSDSVLQINVTNPGKGYAVLPELVVEPSIEVTFSNADVNSTLHILTTYVPNLQTGDQVQYRKGTGPGVGKLVDGAWYYINVLETSPNTVIAFYSMLEDALANVHRIEIYDNGTSTGMTLSYGARAIAITKASPVRENITTIKFDRTSYDSQVTPWRAGTFYGSSYADSYNNTTSLSSSSLSLENVTPNINDILASTNDIVFEVVDVENEETLTWSSFARTVGATFAANDAIRLVPLDGNNDPLNPEPNSSGTTVGFYKNMPIKFTGSMIGGIVDGQTYYVSEIISDIDFTISQTIDGSVFALTNGTASVTMNCYTGTITSQALVTVNYPGIMDVSMTTATINALTVNLSAIGTGGTTGFYPGLTVYFTASNAGEEIFGNIVENEVYYVNTIIDSQRFTVSKTNTDIVTGASEQDFVIYSTDVTATTTGTNIVTVDSTSDFAINDPVIFNSMTVSGISVTSFGNIVSGELYYVSDIVSATQLKISEEINGPVFALANASGTATVTNQKNVVVLESQTGSMTLNVSLPISPGQVNGQRFVMHQTSGQYANISTYTIDNLLTAIVRASIGTNFTVAVNRLAVDNTTSFYVDMPIQLDTAIGGLSSVTTYYVKEYSGMEDPLNPGEYLKNIYLLCTNTSSTGNLITVDTGSGYDTSSLYVGMPIVFSGVGLGNIVVGQEYYIKTIPDSSHFTISETSGGSTFVLATDNGTMAGTGSPYIKVSSTPGGSAIALSNSVAGSTITLTQTVTVNPVFSVSYILGGYSVIIQNGGEGFAVNNTLTIPGNLVGGTTPKNDALLEVNSVDTDGAITSLIVNGTTPEASASYYFKVRDANTFEVYDNSLMTVPTSYDDFPYVGFSSTTVSAVNGTGDVITVADSSIFSLNGQVVFTGNIVGSLELGQIYYVVNIPSSTQIKVSETVNGATFDPGTASGSFTVSKAGSFAFLSEPFYFSPSIVRFNGRLYSCLVSNNDSEFVFGKWELVDSGARNINAMDRVIGYYQPTVNMPGVDLTQLFEGVTYPNTTYMGNKFQPSEQFDLDVIIPSLEFYPTTIDLASVTYDGKLVAAINTESYSGTATTGDLVDDEYDWTLSKLANQTLALTDIIYDGGKYIITSRNVATPIYHSDDNNVWSAAGNIKLFTGTNWPNTTDYMVGLEAANMSLNSIAYSNNYIAVGTNIIKSHDGVDWVEAKTFPENRGYELYSVTSANTAQFTGYVAVGKATTLGYANSLPVLNPTSMISYSSDGLYWTEILSSTTKALYAVEANSSLIVASGEDGVIFYSYNGVDWFGLNEAKVTSFSSTNYLIDISPSGFQINDPIIFNKSFSTIVAGTTYYVKTVVSPTLLTISDTLGGSTKVLSAGTVPADTIAYNYDMLGDSKDIVYAANTWVMVGENGIINTSSDGLNWTSQTSGTTENLNSVTYAADKGWFVTVGDNNTVLYSDDLGITWNVLSSFITPDVDLTIKGNDFLYGYGPEELVPGVVLDNMAMTVMTHPGTAWEATVYEHVGYRTASIELSPESSTQTVYSFKNAVEIPTQVFVQVLDSTSKLGTTLYNGIDYTVNWLDKTITLTTPISFIPAETLRIDVFEAGNGDQIAKSNSDVDPIRMNDDTGFNEIYVDCNYSATIYQGSGVVQPGTFDEEVLATQTVSGSNRIVVADVNKLPIGESITFTGDILGGLSNSTTYYVKSVSSATSSITVSTSFNPITGLAGPTTTLTNDTGTMYVNISIGSDVPWTTPIVYCNGVKLTQGYSSHVTRTQASNNAVVTNSTSGMVANCEVTFSNTMFGNIIQPLTTYYVKQVLSPTEFSISSTPGGSVITLTDAEGGATYISYQYAFGIQPDGTSATIMFPTDQYDSTTTYISYTLFGETSPQYGYTLPETEVFTGTGTQTSFLLSNFAGDDNPENAIVELNGVRVTASAYNIDENTNTLNMFTAPALNDVLAVTTFNDTARQYFSSQYGVTSSAGGSITLTVGATNNITGTFDQDTPVAQTFDQNSPSVVPYDANQNWLTLASGDTSELNVNDTIIFSSPTIGGIVAFQTYYVTEILSSTEFVISETLGGESFVLTNATGTMTGTTNSLIVAAITNVETIISPPLAITTATATTTGTNRITVTSTTGFVANQPVDFRGTSAGGILTDGTMYYVDTIVSGTQFTIKDQNNVQVPLTTAVVSLQVTVGGTPTATITTAVDPGFLLNTLVRIDGVLGSTQLNNGVFYVRPIDTNRFQLYTEPYTSAFNGVNYPVTDVSLYLGEGYVWPNGLVHIKSLEVTQTIASTDTLVTTSTSKLVIGTPIYFSKSGQQNGDNILGGIIQGTEYYVYSIDSGTQFSVSETRDGGKFALSNATGTIDATQWNQTNVDRLWVTINGLRVPSSKLRLNDYNELSILAPITAGDEVIITSMMPSATPNQELYMNMVSATQEPTVYRIPANAITWIADEVTLSSTEITLNDVGAVTKIITLNETTPALVSGYYMIGLPVDKRILSDVVVFNDTTNQAIASNNITVELYQQAPVIKIAAGAYITAGDLLTITVVEGSTIYVMGEQINFGKVDFATNKLLEIQRGANGTACIDVIPEFSEVRGMLSENKLADSDYNVTWNSYVFNTVEGDPLQISETTPAVFLNTSNT